MGTVTWLLATHNRGKLKELRAILGGYPVDVVSLGDLEIDEESPETGDTFLDNAMQKAAFYRRLLARPTLADDSGLEVDALNGAPGIFSARFGGYDTHEEKCAYLLTLLQDTPAEYRTARFHCAAVYYDGMRYISASGSIEGFIGFQPIGDGGFGYDPIFHPSWEGPSLAQIDPAEKNRISHRGQAFRELVRSIAAYERDLH